jgi:DNA-binding NarL/FixJ family response regulator
VKVFLVENSPLLCDRLRALLQAVPGMEVVGEAATVADALQGIVASGAQAAVIDLHLEGSGSGFDVLRGLRKSAPAVAAYVLSNFVSEAYQRAAQRLGARGYFDKASEIPLLLAALSEKS